MSSAITVILLMWGVTCVIRAEEHSKKDRWARHLLTWFIAAICFAAVVDRLTP